MLFFGVTKYELAQYWGRLPDGQPLTIDNGAPFKWDGASPINGEQVLGSLQMDTLRLGCAAAYTATKIYIVFPTSFGATV